MPIVGDAVYKTGRNTGTTKGQLINTYQSIILGAPNTFNLEVFCLNAATMWVDEGAQFMPVGGFLWRPVSARWLGTTVGSYHPAYYVELPGLYYNPWEEMEAQLGLGTFYPHS